MKEINLNEGSESYKFTLGESEFVMKEPVIKSLAQIGDVKGADGKEDHAKICAFYESMGMPKDLYWDLTARQLQVISETIFKKKI